MIKKLFLTSLSVLALTSTSLNADIKDLFVGATLGYAQQSVEQEDKLGSIILGNELDESGYNFELGLGYDISDSVAVSLNYQRVILDDTFSNNIYLGAEYQFGAYKDITPYLGVNLGYSQLQWSKKPLNTKENNYISTSWLAGVNLGLSYPITKNMDFIGKYTFNLTDHKTLLESGSAKSELLHNYSHNFNIGVRIYFK